MVTIGNTTLPGVETTVESSRSVSVGLGSAGRALFVGDGDVFGGSAESNRIYEVRTPTRARMYFGNESPLTIAVIDALREGAFPVYACATRKESIEAEDVTTETGTLAQAPLSENAADTVFTVDSSELTTIVVFGELNSDDVGAGEVHVNPVTGEYALDTAPATTGSADYYSLEYGEAFDVVVEDSAPYDFVAVLSEHEDTVVSAVDAVTEMQNNYRFGIVLAGVTPYLSDINAYSTSFDSSRLQLVYPSRNSRGDTIIGSYAGMRAAIGISVSPIRRRLASQNDLIVSLSTEEQEFLYSERVNPIADEAGGSRVIEDITTVSETNENESEMRQGISRLIVDAVTDIVQSNADNFIGELHTQAARNALQSSIKSELKDLMSLNVVIAYTVSVDKEDSMTASVDVGVETTKPLRNIVATVTAGDVN